MSGCLTDSCGRALHANLLPNVICGTPTDRRAVCRIASLPTNNIGTRFPACCSVDGWSVRDGPLDNIGTTWNRIIADPPPPPPPPPRPPPGTVMPKKLQTHAREHYIYNTHTHTHTRTHTHALTYARSHSSTHAREHTHTHELTRIPKHRHGRTQIDTLTHNTQHTHTHTY